MIFEKHPVWWEQWGHARGLIQFSLMEGDGDFGCHQSVPELSLSVCLDGNHVV